MQEFKVFCIIVTYNAMKWIDKCLTSLMFSNEKPSIVVVDNCSNDLTIPHISKKYPDVHLIINQKNKGFGQANNQGIEYAYNQGATHFFLLNQDTWIANDTIKNLILIQDKHEISVVSPIHLNGTGDLLDFSYFMSTVIHEKNREFVSDLILGKTRDYYKVYSINAAAWMLSRKTVERIGGFDPVFFHYGEDDNYCQRIKYHNGSVAFIPNSFIHHDRIEHGNMQVFNKNSITATLLTVYGNINTNFWRIDKKRFLMHMSYCKLALSFLLKLRFKSFVHVIKSYLVFFNKTPVIIRNIKLNRVEGNNWLDL